MTPERWELVKGVLGAVLDAAPEDRENVISNSCSDDRDLEVEVRQYLVHAEEVGPLDSPVIDEFERATILAGFDQAGLSIGLRLAGRFELIRQVGGGGMGEVWEAYDHELKSTVAVKTIHPEFRADPRFIERFKKEVLHARSVAHANVCRVHDFFIHHSTSGEVPFMTMEFLRGGTLADRLKRPESLPGSLARQVLRQCADALDQAHRVGLVHRDFKPGNVMLVPESDGAIRTVVTDFGLSYVTKREPEASTILAAGTPAYCAPEQSTGQNPTPAADIYSLAIVACEVLSGKRPSEGGLQRLPASLRTAISRGLTPDPASRPGSARALLELDRKPKSHLTFPLAGALALMVVGGVWWQAQTPSIRPAIAILPFTFSGLSQDSSYLAEAIPGQIADALTLVRELRVIAQSSASRFRSSSLELRDIAGRLSAQYLMTGSIRSEGERFIISAQLVDPLTNTQIWAQQFDRAGSQLASIQPLITRGVAAGLKIPLAAGQVFLYGSRTPKPEAYEAYLRGRNLWRRRDEVSLRGGLAAFEKAVELDPQFAQAQAAKSDTLSIMGEYGILPTSNAYPRAKEAALKAVIIDPNLAEAHAALGLALSNGDRDYYNAGKSFQEALRLNPNYYFAHHWYALMLMRMGDYAKSVQEAEEAVSLDPVSAASLANLGWMNFYARRFETSLQAVDRLQTVDPAFPFACLLRAELQARLGRPAEARDALLHCSPTLGNHPHRALTEGIVAALSHDLAGADAAVERLKQAGPPHTGPPTMIMMALVYSAMGRKDDAFEWLERGAIANDPLVPIIQAHPAFDALRGDPRLPVFLARVGLKERKGSD